MTRASLRAPLRGSRVVSVLAGATAAVVLAACADRLVGPPPATSHAAVFDQAWHDIDLHYPFFIYKNLNWDSLGAAYRPRAIAAATDLDFANVLGALLVELHDAHVSLDPTGVEGSLRYLPQTANGPDFFNPIVTTAHYVSAPHTTAGGHIDYGMLSANVGYVRIASLVGDGWDGEMDEALGALPSARALVLDLRGNQGGNRSIALAIAGRFADGTRTFGYLRFRDGPSHSDLTAPAPETVAPAGARHFAGPVYVMTDRRDYSSAEELVLAMRVQPQTTIVGDTTGGASGGPVTRELSNGWTYELSEWMESTATGAMYEGIGLAPDVVVSSPATDATTGRDTPLERALALAGPRIQTP